MINGKEVHQMAVNGKVVYCDDDTITDPARLLEDIHRRVIESGNITVNGKKITHVLVDGPGATDIGITDFSEYCDLNTVLEEMFNKADQYGSSKKR